MNLEIALQFIDAALLAKQKRKLNSLEISILRGSWQGQTYEQIAESSEYSFNYLMRDVGPKFWRLLTEVFGENVNKNNIQKVVNKLYKTSNFSFKKTANLEFSKQEKNNQAVDRSHLQDWENAPARLNILRGYQDELNTLEQWIENNNCHLINVWGISGVGKTTLVREAVERVKGDFQFVLWRSLASAPSFSKFVASLAKVLDIDLQNQSKSLSSKLLTKMRSRSCSIVLDGVEAILQPGQQAGTYRAGYEEYDEFFRLVGESFHQSCIVTTSLESLSGIFQFTGENSPIRSLKLSGLSSQSAQTFLADRQLNAQSASQNLIPYYQGNPAMLSIATRTIKKLFNNSIEEFLAQKSLVFGNIDRLLRKSFIRLSLLEKEVLYWLTSEESPVTLPDIQARIPISIYPVELLETVESLNQRSLIETTKNKNGSSSFILSPIIRDFTINQFIIQMGGDSSFKNRHQILPGLATGTIKLNALGKKKSIHLSQWLENRFELEWQPIETLFSLSNKSPIRLRNTFHFRDRATIKRFKEITLDKDRQIKVLLFVAVTQEEFLKICVQAQPEITKRILPDGLQVCLVDAANNIAVEIISGKQDNFIQLPCFYGDLGEKFKIRLNLKSVSTEEEFMI